MIDLPRDDSALLDINYDQYLEQYLADMEIENDILLDLLSEQFYKYDRNLKNSRRVRKRNLKMERNRRSFDSISHVTGGFIGQNTANNPTLRRLQQLAALHQRRKLFGMNTLQFPHGSEILFPILHRSPDW